MSPSLSSVRRRRSQASPYQESSRVPAPVSPLMVPMLSTVPAQVGLSLRLKPSSMEPSQSSLAPVPSQSSVVEPVASLQRRSPPLQETTPSSQRSLSVPSQGRPTAGSSEPSALAGSQSWLPPPHRSRVEGVSSLQVRPPLSLQAQTPSVQRSVSPSPSQGMSMSKPSSVAPSQSSSLSVPHSSSAGAPASASHSVPRPSAVQTVEDTTRQ